MTNYILALRLPIAVLAGLLCLVSFKISQIQYSALLPIAFTIFLAGTCMVQNDWRDRKHDKLKGKNFALEHETQFLIFLIVLWSATILLAILLYQEQIEYCWIAIGGIISGFVYSETRKIPLVSALFVALTSASSTLFPATVSFSLPILFLFLCTTLLIFGREILKDVDDVEYDGGYKWTLPVSIGTKQAKVVAGMFILTASATSLALSLKTSLGVTLLTISAICLMTNRNHKTAKKLIDAGVLLSLMSLLVFGI